MSTTRSERAAPEPRRDRTTTHGVLLVDKAAGMTSHDVVREVRRAFGQREVGHTGTLDPLATGLMLVTLGRATRIGRFLEVADKIYEGRVHLGRATTTLDAEGEVTDEQPVGAIEAGEIARALASLTGEIQQEVPAFSAVKVKGERLFSKARRGEEVELPKRQITVHALDALRIAPPEIDVRAHVSKGTYIRVLAVQIGSALGLPAHLSRLRRTRVGSHRVEDAVPLAELDRRAPVLSIEAALRQMARIRLPPRETEHVRHGRPLNIAALAPLVRAQAVRFEAGDPILLLDAGGDASAVAWANHADGELETRKAQDPALRYACVLAPPIAR